ncbi:hypothetical protein [Streptomyces hesseae]|uniref:Uncharacterized protein n=1 Tax=Streptomyces hesseae TaxID=3075519 RepID=A0ABU2SGU9_9ACTN|nr:hypothetical protein [Streptomyces sp. DSM 40473]MDT0448206.1 hypothetical protein [Streptomyces sp. DSM 40473]
MRNAQGPHGAAQRGVRPAQPVRGEGRAPALAELGEDGRRLAERAERAGCLVEAEAYVHPAQRQQGVRLAGAVPHHAKPGQGTVEMAGGAAEPAVPYLGPGQHLEDVGERERVTQPLRRLQGRLQDVDGLRLALPAQQGEAQAAQGDDPAVRVAEALHDGGGRLGVLLGEPVHAPVGDGEAAVGTQPGGVVLLAQLVEPFDGRGPSGHRLVHLPPDGQGPGQGALGDRGGDGVAVGGGPVERGLRDPFPLVPPVPQVADVLHRGGESGRLRAVAGCGGELDGRDEAGPFALQPAERVVRRGARGLTGPRPGDVAGPRPDEPVGGGADTGETVVEKPGHRRPPPLRSLLGEGTLGGVGVQQIVRAVAGPPLGVDTGDAYEVRFEEGGEEGVGGTGGHGGGLMAGVRVGDGGRVVAGPVARRAVARAVAGLTVRSRAGGTIGIGPHAESRAGARTGAGAGTRTRTHGGTRTGTPAETVARAHARTRAEARAGLHTGPGTGARAEPRTQAHLKPRATARVKTTRPARCGGRVPIPAGQERHERPGREFR